MSAAMPPFHWHGTMAEFDAEIRRRWIESSDRLGLDHGMPNAAAVLAAQDARPAPELGLPYSRCPRWSHPADDFHGQCVTYAGHGGEHENEHGIRWTGQRWEGVKPQPKAAPELAAAVPVAETVLDLLDDFTHAVIDYRGTSPAITAAAVSVRRKAGLPPVEGK